ncbi:hypothetical protein Scep_016739 [Stephania cephalantha]|uniref:Uncharacterized protein n=1 Tax=Stephania cephalantha TaxID=152367 RepID=A0AAP0NW76_9MAGN
MVREYHGSDAKSGVETPENGGVLAVSRTGVTLVPTQVTLVPTQATLGKIQAMCQPHLHAHKNPPNTPTYTYTPPTTCKPNHSFILAGEEEEICWRGMNHQGFEGIHGSL